MSRKTKQNSLIKHVGRQKKAVQLVTMKLQVL